MDFLRKNRAVVLRVCLFEYDQEKHIKMEKAESYQDGIALGEERGKRLGQEMGQDIINRLNQSLIADNRLEDLTRSVQDPIYQEELLKEYDILM